MSGTAHLPFATEIFKIFYSPFSQLFHYRLFKLDIKNPL